MPAVAVIAIENVPLWVGVPLRTPALERVKPVGNVLDVLNVEPVLLLVKLWLYAVPAVAVSVAPLGLTVIVGQFTVRL